MPSPGGEEDAAARAEEDGDGEGGATATGAGRCQMRRDRRQCGRDRSLAGSLRHDCPPRNRTRQGHGCARMHSSACRRREHHHRCGRKSAFGKIRGFSNKPGSQKSAEEKAGFAFFPPPLSLSMPFEVFFFSRSKSWQRTRTFSPFTTLRLCAFAPLRSSPSQRASTLRAEKTAGQTEENEFRRSPKRRRRFLFFVSSNSTRWPASPTPRSARRARSRPRSIRSKKSRF